MGPHSILSGDWLSSHQEILITCAEAAGQCSFVLLLQLVKHFRSVKASYCHYAAGFIRYFSSYLGSESRGVWEALIQRPASFFGSLSPILVTNGDDWRKSSFPSFLLSDLRPFRRAWDIEFQVS